MTLRGSDLQLLAGLSTVESVVRRLDQVEEGLRCCVTKRSRENERTGDEDQVRADMRKRRLSWRGSGRRT